MILRKILMELTPVAPGKFEFTDLLDCISTNETCLETLRVVAVERDQSPDTPELAIYNVSIYAFNLDNEAVCAGLARTELGFEELSSVKDKVYRCVIYL